MIVTDDDATTIDGTLSIQEGGSTDNASTTPTETNQQTARGTGTSRELQNLRTSYNPIPSGCTS